MKPKDSLVYHHFYEYEMEYMEKKGIPFTFTEQPIFTKKENLKDKKEKETEEQFSKNNKDNKNCVIS
jgi:hypothetical protein